MEDSTVKHTLDLTGLSARSRRIAVLGVRGGADDTPLTLEDLMTRVEGIAELTTEDIAQLDADLTALATTAEDSATLLQIRDAVTTVRTVHAERAAAAAA